MNTNLLNIVKQIIAVYGEGILGDPQRLKAFFSDLAKDEPKPLRVAFGRCIESGAYAALKTAPDAAGRASRKTLIARQLQDKHGLDMALCAEALDILEAALFGKAQAAYQPPASAAPTPQAVQTQAPLWTPQAAPGKPKSLGTAYLLWFFLGLAGAHEFYLGRNLEGILRIVINVFLISVLFILAEDPTLVLLFFLLLFALWIFDAVTMKKQRDNPDTAGLLGWLPPHIPGKIVVPSFAAALALIVILINVANANAVQRKYAEEERENTRWDNTFWSGTYFQNGEYLSSVSLTLGSTSFTFEGAGAKVTGTYETYGDTIKLHTGSGLRTLTGARSGNRITVTVNSFQYFEVRRSGTSDINY